MTFSVQCIVSLFNYCVFVASSAVRDIFHSHAARYSLLVLKVSLNTSVEPVEACLCVIQLDVPPANAVAVVIGNDCTQLERLGRSSTVWEGAVDMTEFFGRESKKLFVCADCGSGVTSSCHTLLEYTV